VNTNTYFYTDFRHVIERYHRTKTFWV